MTKERNSAVQRAHEAVVALKDREAATVVLGIEKLMWPANVLELRVQVTPDYFQLACQRDSRNGEFNDVGYRAAFIGAEVAEKVRALLIRHTVPGFRQQPKEDETDRTGAM